MNRAEEIIKSGDAKAIIGMALHARFAADRGEFCQCDEPDVVERDLMCGKCLLENEGQREKRLRYLNDPHPFEEGGRLDGYWCKRCTYPKTDLRHEVSR